jgi:alpha-beta hydrolase superfamily lysophospholipase
MKYNEGTFKGAGGLDLYYQSWQPEGAARAALALVHGLGEHGGRYMNIVNHLVPKGYAIYALDHRGMAGHPALAPLSTVGQNSSRMWARFPGLWPSSSQVSPSF